LIRRIFAADLLFSFVAAECAITGGTRGISRLTVLDLFRVRLGLYKRSALSARFRPAVLGFPRYMQFVWGMDHWWQAPMRCIRTIWRRLTKSK
jgi:hypothetical protein